MKKIILLISVLTVVLFVATACGNDDSKKPAEATSTPTAAAPTTSTDTPAAPTDTPAAPTDTPAAPTDTPAAPTDTPAAPTEVPTTPTAAPTDVPTPVSPEQLIEAAQTAYNDNAEKAINYFLGRLSSSYAYRVSYYTGPDNVGMYKTDFYNAEDICIKSEFYYDDGSSYTVVYDKPSDHRGSQWLNENDASDIRNEYMAVGHADNKSDNYIYYTDCTYDNKGNITEETIYRYFLNYDVNNGFQVKPISELNELTEIMYHFVYTYATDEQGNTLRTDAAGSCEYRVGFNHDLEFIDLSNDSQTFAFAPNGNLLYISAIDPYDNISVYHKEDRAYDKDGNLVALTGFGSSFKSESWTYDNNRLISHKGTVSSEQFFETFTYDDNGLLTHSSYIDQDIDSYLSRETEYYGAEGNSFGSFAGKPYQYATTYYTFDPSLNEWVPDETTTTTIYLEYISFQQTINDTDEE